MQPPDTADGTREKILQVTIDLIRTNCHHNELTVRQITQAAEVNVGSINYYFGSKDSLIDEALQTILQEILSTFVPLDDQESPPLLRLRSFLIRFTQAMLSCHVQPIFHIFRKRKQTFHGKQAFMDFFWEMGFDKIKHTVMEITGEQDEDQACLLLLQILSAILMPNLMMVHATKLPLIQVPHIPQQVDQLLGRFFGQNPGGPA